MDSVNLEVKPGDFIAILGHNGSGKSTLAKHINALLVPTSGTIWAVSYTHLDVYKRQIQGWGQGLTLAFFSGLLTANDTAKDGAL